MWVDRSNVERGKGPGAVLRANKGQILGEDKGELDPSFILYDTAIKRGGWRKGKKTKAKTLRQGGSHKKRSKNHSSESRAKRWMRQEQGEGPVGV